MKASDLFIKALENEGIEYIFGIPGEENLDLMESLRTSKKIKFILTRHEQAAGFMSATYGRLTGRLSACISTLGPGATNFTTAAAYANLGGFPMLIITGQKPIKKSKQGSFQIIDVVSMMKPLTKYTRQIINQNNIPATVRTACKIAVSERPGPVHLEFPEDISRENEDRSDVYKVTQVSSYVSDNESLKLVASMIMKSRSPLICVAAGANRAGSYEHLSKFINATNIPFFDTQMGKGAMNENTSHYLGCAVLSRKDFVHHAIQKSDLILMIGYDTIEKPPFFMDGNTPVIHMHAYPSATDDVYFPSFDLIGDINLNLDALARLITPSKSWDFSYFYKVQEAFKKHLEEFNNLSSFPLAPPTIVKVIRDNLGDEDILTLDNGMYKIWFGRNYDARRPNTILLDNALATMGAGLPSAIASKIVYPDKKVLAVCGDGGFMMNSQELETAVRLNLDLVIIVLNDQALQMIKWKQGDMNFPSFALDYNNPNLVEYANSYGAHGYQPTSLEEFKEMLKSTLNSKGVHLIDLAIDYSLNHPTFTEFLPLKKLKD